MYPFLILSEEVCMHVNDRRTDAWMISTPDIASGRWSVMLANSPGGGGGGGGGGFGDVAIGNATDR